MDSLLNLIPAVMGLGFIDENLHDLLKEMKDPAMYLVNLTSMAKSIGCCIALGVGANECYQMMLGRRGMDVMKLLHIVIISFCITFADTIAAAAAAPGYKLEQQAELTVLGQTDEIDVMQKLVAKKQREYLDSVRSKQIKLQEEQRAAHVAEDHEKSDVFGIGDKIEEVVTVVVDKLSFMAMLAEQTICEWLSIIIRFLGELLFQVMIYATLVAQRVFLAILRMFAPLMFALSLSPHFKSAWSQWLSKYLSISLWGFVAYTCVFYGLFVIKYNLEQDLGSYEMLMNDIGSNLNNLAVIGMNSLGSTCMYVIGCLVGVKLLAMVPEVCSWLIPGGVSSSAGSAVGAMGAAATGAGVAAASMAAPVAGQAVGATASGAATMAKGYGSYISQQMSYQGSTQQHMDQNLTRNRAMGNYNKSKM